MADDNSSRSYRSTEPYRRGSQTGASDPLAELARLIGESDPFAEGRGSSRERQPASSSSPSGVPDREAASYREPHVPAAGRESYATGEGYGHPYPLVPVEAHAADQGRYGQPYDDLPAGDDQAGSHDRRYETAEAGYDAEEHYHQDSAPLAPQEEDMYDDPPRARRHGGLATAIALIGCAMLGTAGAYGYRTYYALPADLEPPPVIAADTTTPTKVVPATTIDPQSSKAMDRLAVAAGNEQLVRRQEEPVALKELGTTSAPRVVLPAPVSPGQNPPSAQPQNPPAGAGSNSSEPKRVRTVTIRPEGSDVSGRPVAAPTAAPRGAATQTPAPVTPPAPRATTTRGGGPISLDPQGQPSETASVPPPRARTATAPQATPETANASGGGYLVQLSSQRSESEARSAYRALQGKYPNELGNREPVIRRADLGSKGVYYRTMVGPFRTAQEATQFCATYKAAGGQCVVPTN